MDERRVPAAPRLGAAGLCVSLGVMLALAGCIRFPEDGIYLCESDEECVRGRCESETGRCVVDRIEVAAPVIHGLEVHGVEGCIPITFEISHPDRLPVDGRLEYRAPAQPWRPATPVVRGDEEATWGSEEAPHVGLSRLPAGQSPRGYTFVWASDRDLPGFDGTVEVRLRARVDGGPVAEETRAGSIGNHRRFGPVVSVGTLPPAARWMLPVRAGGARAGIAALSPDRDLRIWLPGSAGVLEPAAIDPDPGDPLTLWTAAAVDLDGDGWEAIVALADPAESDTLWIAERKRFESGYATRRVLLPAYLEGPAVAAHVGPGDVFGEGARYTVAVAHGRDEGPWLTVFVFTPGDGEVVPRAFALDTPLPRAVRVADLTGDARLEIVLAHAAGISVMRVVTDVAGTVDLVEIATWGVPLDTIHDVVAGEDGWLAISATANATDQVHVLRLDPGLQSFTTFSAPVDGVSRLTPPYGKPGRGAEVFALDAERIQRLRLSDAGLDEAVVHQGDEGFVDLAVTDLEGRGARTLLFINDTGGERRAHRFSEEGPLRCRLDLEAPTSMLMPDPALALTVMHVDADGRPDLITAHSEGEDWQPAVEVRFGDGIGGFRTPRGSHVGLTPGVDALAAADFTGDGHEELIVVHREEGVGVVGRCGLLFDEEESCPWEHVRWIAPEARLAVPIVGGGVPMADLLVAAPGADALRLLLGTDRAAEEGLVDGGTVAPGASPIVAVAATRVAGEVEPTTFVAVVREPVLEIWAYTGTSGDRLEAFDLPAGVREVDLVVAGDGVLWALVVGDDGLGWALHVRGDLGSDGSLDLEGRLRRPGGTLVDAALDPSPADGVPVAVVLGEVETLGAVVRWLPGHGVTGQAAEPRMTVPLGGRPGSLRAVDLTGDGRLEILAAIDLPAGGGSIVTFHTDPTEQAPVRAPSTYVFDSGNLVTARVADVRGHGLRDLVILNDFEGEAQVFRITGWLEPGEAQLEAMESTTVHLRVEAGPPVDVAILDLDGDRRPDLAVLTGPSSGTPNDPGELHLFKQGPEAFRFQHAWSMPDGPRALSVGVLSRFGPALATASDGGVSLLAARDEDGWQDATAGSRIQTWDVAGARDVVIDSVDSDVARRGLVFATGSGVHAHRASDEPAGAPFVAMNPLTGFEDDVTSVALADVTGNGGVDVIVGGAEAFGVHLITAGGQSIGASWLENRAAGPVTDVAAARLGGEGLPVILVLHGSTGLLRVFRKAEAGQNMDLVATYRVGPGGRRLQIVDADGDGRLGVVVVHPETDRVSYVRVR